MPFILAYRPYEKSIPSFRHGIALNCTFTKKMPTHRVRNLYLLRLHKQLPRKSQDCSSQLQLRSCHYMKGIMIGQGSFRSKNHRGY